MSYGFPKSLIMLELYLRQKGYDVDRLNSDRHALDVLCKLTGIRIKFPSKGHSCYMSLRRLHTELFPSVPMPKAPAKARRVHGIGTTGPASRCRTVPPEVYAAIKAKHEKVA